MRSLLNSGKLAKLQFDFVRGVVTDLSATIKEMKEIVVDEHQKRNLLESPEKKEGQ